MTLDEIPLFAMLKSKLSYTNERQRLIAQNIANADTPGYAPMDLKPFTFQQALNGASGASAGSGSGGLEMQRSDPRHMAARRTPAGPLRPMTSPARQPNSRSAATLKDRITPFSSITTMASGMVSRIDCRWASRSIR